jgi:hypothetical protein
MRSSSDNWSADDDVVAKAITISNSGSMILDRTLLEEQKMGNPIASRSQRSEKKNLDDGQWQ